MSRHEARFELLRPGFYVENLLREHNRYGLWTGGVPEGLTQVRLGFWVLVIGTIGGLVVAWARARKGRDPRDLLLVLSVPTMAFLLGLLLSLKRHFYLVLLLPFLAILISVFVVTVWRWSFERPRGFVVRAVLGLIGVLVVVESAIDTVRMGRSARATTPYREITAAIARRLTPGSRLLIAQPFWLGLAEYETRSLNLLFVGPPETVEQAMARLAPDYVIAEGAMFTPQYTSTRDVVERWQELGRYLDAHCRKQPAIDDRSYGIVDIYACGRRSGAAADSSGVSARS